MSINLAQHLYQLHYFIPGVLEYLWTGVDESDCQLPCETFSTDTKLTTSKKYQDYIGFGINFQQQVEVKSDKLFFYQRVQYLFTRAGDHNSNHKTNLLQLFVRCKYKLLKFIEFVFVAAF